jgi:cytochrome P450 family 628
MIELLQDGMAPLGVITPIPWLLVLLVDIPGVAAGPKKFVKYHKEQVEARKKVIFAIPVLQHRNQT